MIYYLYIIRCSDNYLYIGITNNIRKRILEHKNNSCPCTKNRGNIDIVYTETFNSRKEAALREKELKGWRRSKKEKLISENSLH